MCVVRWAGVVRGEWVLLMVSACCQRWTDVVRGDRADVVRGERVLSEVSGRCQVSGCCQRWAGAVDGARVLLNMSLNFFCQFLRKIQTLNGWLCHERLQWWILVPHPFSHLNRFLGVPVPMATLSSPVCLFFLANRRWYVPLRLQWRSLVWRTTLLFCWLSKFHGIFDVIVTHTLKQCGASGNAPHWLLRFLSGPFSLSYNSLWILQAPSKFVFFFLHVIQKICTYTNVRICAWGT